MLSIRHECLWEVPLSKYRHLHVRMSFTHHPPNNKLKRVMEIVYSASLSLNATTEHRTIRRHAERYERAFFRFRFREFFFFRRPEVRFYCAMYHNIIRTSCRVQGCIYMIASVVRCETNILWYCCIILLFERAIGRDMFYNGWLNIFVISLCTNGLPIIFATWKKCRGTYYLK